MGIKVYYSEISAHKEVKKRQQKVMMILESKQIPYEAIDITEAGKESDKDFMLANAKPKGESKFAESPQVFNEENYCGDYDDFELANENDELEQFLNIAKIENSGMIRIGNQNQNGTVVPTTNGTNSRESSAEKQAAAEVVAEKVEEVTSSETNPNPEPLLTGDEAEVPCPSVRSPPPAPLPDESGHPEMDEEEEEAEPMSTSEPVAQPPPPSEELLEDIRPDSNVKDEEEEEEVED